MCAPCKVILDEAVKGMLEDPESAGRPQDAALAGACAAAVNELSEDVQNDLIRADYWLLTLPDPDAKDIEKWRKRVFRALEKQAGFKFGERPGA